MKQDKYDAVMALLQRQQDEIREISPEWGLNPDNTLDLAVIDTCSALMEVSALLQDRLRLIAEDGPRRKSA